MKSESAKPVSSTADGFLSRGFRPFFLGGAILAAVAVPLWVASFAGWLVFAQDALSLEWHTHEMIFGYTGAVLAGFALTAVPNWTGRLPVAGRRLAILLMLWVAGRAAVLATPAIGEIAAAIIDIVFPVMLALYLLRETLAARNLRNLPIAGLVSVFACANVFWHISRILVWDVGLAERCGLAVIALLIALVGGRITPSFTHNWLMKTGRKVNLPSVTWLDKTVLAIAASALVFWAVAPTAFATGMLGLLAGAGLGFRLSRWRGWLTVLEPLVLILHVGYLWLALSLALLGTAALAPDFINHQMALHALAAGAIGTMTLAVMTRASLGHTGSALSADGVTVIIYAFVTAGAVLRTVASGAIENYAGLLLAAGLLWSGAFALFVVSYGPRLVKPVLRTERVQPEDAERPG